MNKMEEFVRVAEGQVGYREQGNNNTKYGIWYGLNYQPWCAMFVSWCANQVGIMGTAVPRFASCLAGVQWYSSRGLYRYKSGYSPKRGDVIFFGSNGGEHVGIVKAYDSASGNITTVEGNYSDAVKIVNRNIRSGSVHGFGTNTMTWEEVKYTHIALAQCDIVQSDDSYISTLYAGQRCQLRWVTSDYRKYVRLGNWDEGLVEESKTSKVVPIDEAYSHYNCTNYTVDVKDDSKYEGEVTGAVWVGEKICLIWTNDRGNCFIAYDNSAGEKLCKTGYVPASTLERIGYPLPEPEPDPTPKPEEKKYEYIVEVITTTDEKEANIVRDKLIELGYLNTKISSVELPFSMS